jgi:hypothetical protein
MVNKKRSYFMNETKILQKPKRKTFLFFCVIGLSFLIVGSLAAQTIPQKIGFKDVKFSNLTRTECSACHEGSLVDTHHSTSPAVSGDCSACHKVSTQAGNVGVALERNCMACHSKSPHHMTETAMNNECTTCHDSAGVSDFSNEAPTYAMSKVTPTPAHCRNCHNVGVVDGVNVVSVKDTHHGISLKGCSKCHDEGDKKETSIRTCQRCHSVKAIHEVLPHVEKDSCVKCHGGEKPAA